MRTTKIRAAAAAAAMTAGVALGSGVAGAAPEVNPAPAPPAEVSIPAAVQPAVLFWLPGGPAICSFLLPNPGLFVVCVV